MKFLGYLFILLLLWGCAKQNSVAPVVSTPQTSDKSTSILQGDPVSYLALGDSYTYGDGVSQSNSFPYQLNDTLKQRGYIVTNPIEVARFGWTSGDLLAALSSAGIHQKFSFVTLLIGVNDQVKGVSTQNFTANLDTLITMALNYTGGNKNRVFVLSIPDWSVTPFAKNMDQSEIAAGVQLFNTLIQVEVNKFAANYVDLSALSELAATDPTLTSGDNLHPSAKMYALWVKQFAGKIIGSFKQ